MNTLSENRIDELLEYYGTCKDGISFSLNIEEVGNFVHGIEEEIIKLNPKNSE
jgi:hypothetical protein